ncbi:MAG: DUF4143 domain-containing protein, partial [Candidatus Woesearchaeota archaeon]
NALNMNWNKLQEYISVLVKTDILLAVQPFFTNKSKELVKTPKVYFVDLGLLNALLDTFSSIMHRVDKGEILESFVLHELYKRGYTPKFWNRQLSEVDFVLERDGKRVAIECKSHLSKMPLSLKNFCNEYDVYVSYIFCIQSTISSSQYTISHYINSASIDFFQ